MKRLLITMFHLYFSERIIFWLVGLGIFSAITAYLAPISPVLFTFLSVVFIILIPWLITLLKFNIFLSNKNLSMVPYWRQSVIGATLSLITIFTSLLTLGISILKKGSAEHLPEIFWTIFCFSSLIVFVSKFAFRNFFTRFLLWCFAMLFLINLKFLNNFIQTIDSTILISGTALTSLVVWFWILFTLARAGDKKVNNFTINSIHEYLSSKLDKPSHISAFNTLISGSVARKKSRISSAITIYVVLTLVAIALIKMLTSHNIHGEELLIIQFIVLLQVPASAGESLARMRLLWLKVPGNREQFWLLWKNNLHAQLKLSISIQVVIGVLIYQIYDISNVMITLFASIIFILVPTFSYFTALIRLKNKANPLLTIVSGLIVIGSIMSLMLATLLQESIYPIIQLSIFSILVGSFCYSRVKDAFLSIDWLVIRPIKRNQDILGMELDDRIESRSNG